MDIQEPSLDNTFLMAESHPMDFIFYGDGKELFTIKPTGEVIMRADVYECAKGFWDVVEVVGRQYGFTLTKKG